MLYAMKMKTMHFYSTIAVFVFLWQTGYLEASELIDCPPLDPSTPNLGCPCKCVDDDDVVSLKQVTVDKQYCTDLEINNQKFEEIASDVSITISAGTEQPKGFKFIKTFSENLAPLVGAKIGGQLQSYTSIYFIITGSCPYRNYKVC